MYGSKLSTFALFFIFSFGSNRADANVCIESSDFCSNFEHDLQLKELCLIFCDLLHCQIADEYCIRPEFCDSTNETLTPMLNNYNLQYAPDGFVYVITPSNCSSNGTCSIEITQPLPLPYPLYLPTPTPLSSQLPSPLPSPTVTPCGVQSTQCDNYSNQDNCCCDSSICGSSQTCTDTQTCPQPAIDLLDQWIIFASTLSSGGSQTVNICGRDIASSPPGGSMNKFGMYTTSGPDYYFYFDNSGVKIKTNVTIAAISYLPQRITTCVWLERNRLDILSGIDDFCRFICEVRGDNSTIAPLFTKSQSDGLLMDKLLTLGDSPGKECYQSTDGCSNCGTNEYCDISTNTCSGKESCPLECIDALGEIMNILSMRTNCNKESVYGLHDETSEITKCIEWNPNICKIDDNGIRQVHLDFINKKNFTNFQISIKNRKCLIKYVSSNKNAIDDNEITENSHIVPLTSGQQNVCSNYFQMTYHNYISFDKSCTTCNSAYFINV